MFKVFKDGQLPTKGSKYSACVDLYAREDVVIGAGETKLIPLGVCIDLEKIIKHISRDCSDEVFDKCKQDEMFGYLYVEYELNNFMASHYLQLMLRSSLSKELIIANGVGVIDLDYEDEIQIRVHNPVQLDYDWGERGSIYIEKGQRVAQITLLEHKAYLFGIETDEERSGGFGSTGQ